MRTHGDFSYNDIFNCLLHTIIALKPVAIIEENLCLRNKCFEI